jgi:hypothetical protein
MALEANGMARSRTRGRALPRQHGQITRSGDLAGRRAGDALLAQADRVGPRSRTLRVLARAFGLRTADRAWRVGAAGEARVGRKLDRLARGRKWQVLHNVVLPGGGDVDHLLVGPAGVIAVNTKHHPRAEVAVGREAVFVRGKAYGYPGKSQREASRVAAVLAAAGLRVNVTAMIVVHGHAGKIRGWLLRRPMGVQVVPSNRVGWWLRLPGRRVLSAEQVEAVYEVARRSATWDRV